MSGGHGHNHAPKGPELPKITAHEVHLPGHGEKMTYADLKERHKQNAEPFAQAAFNLQKTIAMNPSQPKGLDMTRVDGMRGLLTSINTTTGRLTDNDKNFVGHMNLAAIHNQSEAQVNLEAFDSDPNPLHPRVRPGSTPDELRMENRADNVSKLFKKLNTERLYALQSGRPDMAAQFQDQCNTLFKYERRLRNYSKYHPEGNEADSFYREYKTEERLDGQARVIQHDATEEAGKKLDAAQAYYADEINAFNIMAAHASRMPNDIPADFQPHPSIIAGLENPSGPAYNALMRELRAHNAEQDYKYAVETALSLASKEYAKQQSTHFRKAMGGIALGAAHVAYGAKKAHYKIDRRKDRKVLKRKKGQSDAEYRAALHARVEHRRRTRVAKPTEADKPKSKRQKYETARGKYFDESLKHIWNDDTMSDHEKFLAQQDVVVGEGGRMMKLTNEYARKSLMGYIDYAQEKMGKKGAAVGALALLMLGGPAALGIGAAVYAGSKVDNKLRGKMGSFGHVDKWEAKVKDKMAEESHKILQKSVGGNMTRENMLNLTYEQKFLTFEKMNELVDKKYGNAVRIELVRQLIGPAVGVAALGGFSNLDKIPWFGNGLRLPDPAGLIDFLDRITTMGPSGDMARSSGWV